MRHPSSTREMMTTLAVHVHGRTLDAGGGRRAKYREILSAHASEYLCLDMQAGGGVDIVGDVMAMPLEDASFDTVVSNQVLEHIPRPDVFMSEAFRILKAGGSLICTAPFWEPVHADPDDFFRYTPDGLAALCEHAGFQVTKSGAYGGVFAIMYSLLKFKFFNPYRTHSRFNRRLGRITGSLMMFLDHAVHIGGIFADSFVVANKPNHP